MTIKARWITLIVCSVAVAAVLVTTLLLAHPNSAGAGKPQPPEVSQALLKALTDSGIPVESVSPLEDADLPQTYAVLCRSVPTDNATNLGLALRQAAELASRGLPIGALRMTCTDSSGAVGFDQTFAVFPSKAVLGTAADDRMLTALRSDLLDSYTRETASASTATQVQDLLVVQDASGAVVTSIRLVVADSRGAKDALAKGLIQGLVNSSQSNSGGTNPHVNAVTVQVTDPAGEVLVNYFQDLDSGDVFAYADPAVGTDWIDKYGAPLVMR